MKLLLIGLSGSGKSTLAKILGEKLNLEIIEADDEVVRANFGSWPYDDEFITQVFEETNNRVIDFNNFIYVISWMDKNTILKFKKAGFYIIEMHADFDVLKERKIKRDNETPERIEKFQNTYIEYFNTILNQDIKGEYTNSLDSSNKTPDQLLSEVISIIN